MNIDGEVKIAIVNEDVFVFGFETFNNVYLVT